VDLCYFVFRIVACDFDPLVVRGCPWMSVDVLHCLLFPMSDLFVTTPSSPGEKGDDSSFHPSEIASRLMSHLLNSSQPVSEM
jgi:hypothetical protein